MTRPRPRRLHRAGRVAAFLALATNVTAARTQQPTFTSRVESVRVDVEVTRNGRPVDGLTADDFEVFDNDALQAIELVTPGSVPLAVVLALDTSGSLRPAQRAALQAACARVATQITGSDRVALLTFTQQVRLRMPFGGPLTQLAAGVAASSSKGVPGIANKKLMGILSMFIARSEKPISMMSSSLSPKPTMPPLQVFKPAA